MGILALVLTGTALGLAITPLGLLYGVIVRGIPLITQFLMYLSPEVFPLATIDWTYPFRGRDNPPRTCSLLNP